MVALSMASRAGVVRWVLRAGLGLLGMGLLLGRIAAFAITRLPGSFLYGVSTLDPLTSAMVPVVLFVATLGACLIPSWKAAAVDPMNALRHE
jgi:ABC-type lipoprotein release transport system permease subunit